MAAKTSVKVSVTNNAAKDDNFHDLSWLEEDQSLMGSLDVLGNDPGSARLIGVSQYLPTGTPDLVNTGSNFVPTGFTGLLRVSIVNGQLAIDASALNGDLQSLGEGQSSSITFYYTAQMANGAYSTAKVTIEIEGTNDDPEFTASSTLVGTFTDTAADDNFTSVGGALHATDVDANDAGLLTYALAAGEDGLSAYGTLVVNADGTWTFTANDGAIEGLKTSVVETFQVVVNDGHGGSDTATITINLDGANDTPVITGDIARDVTEDSGSYVAGGDLDVADRDTADVGFQAATAVALAGTYGDFTFDETTGAWTYTLRNGDANVQALGQGVDALDTLTVYSADGTAQDISVTVHGVNDDPEVQASSTLAGTFTDTAADDAFASVGGAIVATDADANDAGLLTYALAAGEDGLSAYGTLVVNADGTWTFTANDGAIEGLKAGVVETFQVVVNDGHGGSDTATITINLDGANDTPVITGDIARDVTEDSGSYVVVGALAVADRDTADVGFQAATAAALAGTYGDFTFNETTGAWTYTLRNGAANVQALGDDDDVLDTLTVYSADGTAQNIVVTVHGVNEAASYTPPPVFTGTGDPNDFDSLGNAAGQNLSSSASNGPDTLYGGGGDDTINGGGGNDTLYGGSGADAMNGNGENDALFGGSGNDILNGSNNDDLIIGGYGADQLTGGNGIDTFKYLSALDTGDTILDFAHGTDKLDFTGLGLHFTGGTGALASQGAVGANGIGWFAHDGVVDVYADVSGDGVVDLQITLSTAPVLTTTDFLGVI